MADCHKCKYEVSAECVPRSQKMGFPNCFQNTITHYDSLRAMSMEELAKHLCCPWKECKNMNLECDKCLLDWLKQEVDA